jgi:hypothetical protein
MNTNIKVSRQIARNIILNKHEAKTLPIIPFVDSNKTKHIEEIAGNHLRLLKYYPVGFDFCINLLDIAKRSKISLSDTRYFYEIDIPCSFADEFFAKVNGRTLRQSLMRQLVHDMTNSLIKVKKSGKSSGIISTAPFRIMAKIISDDDGQPCYNIFLSKYLFKEMIECEKYPKRADGYITIPPNLFPLITQAGGGLSSFNPFYRIQIFGLLKKSSNSDDLYFYGKEVDELREHIYGEYLFGKSRKLFFKNKEFNEKKLLYELQENILKLKTLPEIQKSKCKIIKEIAITEGSNEQLGILLNFK